MSGVYGAGVLKGMHELGLVKSIEAIYSGSVGSLNAAYLLSGETERGPAVYWERLQKGFLYPERLLIGTGDLIKNRFFKPIDPSTARNVVDVNYIYNLLAKDAPVNLEKIKNSPIEFYVKIMDVDNGELEYKKFTDLPILDLLKAAVTIKPYFFEETFLNNKRYVDATIKEPLGIDYLLQKYPGRKILVVLNEPIKRGLRHHIKNVIEGLVSSLYPYRISLLKIFLLREHSIRQDIKACLANKNIFLLYPNFNGRVRPRTTTPEKLKESCEAGLQDALKVREFIDCA